MSPLRHPPSAIRYRSAASIEPPKARAIAESIEMAFRQQDDDLTKRLMTKQDGAELKAEIIKWMFLFWIGQTAVTIAIVKFLTP